MHLDILSNILSKFFIIRRVKVKLLQHKFIRVPCTKKSTRVPVSPVPQYGYSVQKVIFEYSFYYTQEKLFFKHTTRTFVFCLRLFAAVKNCFCAFLPRIRDHRQKKKPAFRDIIFFDKNIIFVLKIHENTVFLAQEDISLY